MDIVDHCMGLVGDHYMESVAEHYMYRELDGNQVSEVMMVIEEKGEVPTNQPMKQQKNSNTI